MSFSSLSPQEHYRLYGYLPARQTEELLEFAERRQDIKDAQAHIQEARGQFPQEGFLQPMLKRLNALHIKLRGSNREELSSIILCLEELQQDIARSSEYGYDELRQALRALE